MEKEYNYINIDLGKIFRRKLEDHVRKMPINCLFAIDIERIEEKCYQYTKNKR